MFGDYWIGKLVMEISSRNLGTVVHVHKTPGLGNLYSVVFGSETKVLDESAIVLITGE